MKTTAVWCRHTCGPQPSDFGGNAHRGTRWHLVQSSGGPFHSKITWAGTGLIEGYNRRKSSYDLFIEMECILLRFATNVSNWIQFGSDCKDWKYKDLKLKWRRQRICRDVRWASKTRHLEWYFEILWKVFFVNDPHINIHCSMAQRYHIR